MREAGGEDEQPEDDEEPHLRHVRHALVEGDELPAEPRRRRPDREPDEVDAEESAAVGGVGCPESERCGRGRRDRHERPDRRRNACERPGREHADREPEEQPDADLLDDQRRQVADAVVRTLDPGDQAERQCDRDGVVAARLRLERAGEAAAQPGAPECREHRRRIGRRDDGAEEERLRPGEVEEEVREAAGDAGCDNDADR